MERVFAILAALNGLLSVALGAFGAHGLSSRLSAVPDGAKRLEWWHTAAHYHITHALALAFVAYLAARVPGSASTTAGYAMLAGIALFSGSLYVMSLTGMTALGRVTPVGGLCLLLGWGAALVASMRLS